MPEENLCSQLEIDEALGCQLSFWIVLLLNRTPWKLLRRSWGLLGLPLDLPFTSPELFGVSHKRIIDLGSPLWETGLSARWGIKAYHTWSWARGCHGKLMKAVHELAQPGGLLDGLEV